MSFFHGLKKLFKKPLLTIILILFVVMWFLVVLGMTLIQNLHFVYIISIFSGFLAGFIFVLLIFSLFTTIDKMGAKTIIVALILTIPILLVLNVVIIFFYLFCFFSSLFLIALFTYRWCIKNSIEFDNFLYKHKNSRKITRPIAFFTFLGITFLMVFITIVFFRDNLGLILAANIFFVVIAIDLILLIFVFLRLLLVQKLSAYISLFFLLYYIYVLYVIIDVLGVFDGVINPNVGYEFISFLIDLIMFIYIIGTIFDKIDYIKEKLHVIKADTIALFLMLMKILVKIIEIGVQLNLISLPGFELFKAIIILINLSFFTLFFGLYSIIFHKEGKKKHNTQIISGLIYMNYCSFFTDILISIQNVKFRY